jgi:hypothetical protein
LGKHGDAVEIVTKRRTREHELELIAGKRQLETPHQQADVNALRAVVGVSLVQDHVAQALLSEDLAVLRPEQQILKHREVRQQDVRRSRSNLSPGETLVRVEDLTCIHL